MEMNGMISLFSCLPLWVDQIHARHNLEQMHITKWWGDNQFCPSDKHYHTVYWNLSPTYGDGKRTKGEKRLCPMSSASLGCLSLPNSYFSKRQLLAHTIDTPNVDFLANPYSCIFLLFILHPGPKRWNTQQNQNSLPMPQTDGPVILCFSEN